MSRKCAIHGCEVLLIERAPMCWRHWSRVAAAEQKTLLECTPGSAAHDMALRLARQQVEAKSKPKNIGRTGATYPGGPAIA